MATTATTPTESVKQLRAKIEALGLQAVEEQKHIAAADAILAEPSTTARARHNAQVEREKAQVELTILNNEQQWNAEELQAAREQEREYLRQAFDLKMRVALKSHLKDLVAARKTAFELQALQLAEHEQTGAFIDPVSFQWMTGASWDAWLTALRANGFGDVIDTVMGRNG
jgi:hypothetical protein